MKITIETIPHSQQRYPTVGDWQWDKEGNLTIRVSEMDDNRYEFLVGIHEAIEAFLCKDMGITEQEVDDFDIQYESNRMPGDDSEPGDDMDSPYYSEHQIATGIERILAQQLQVQWKLYEAKINSL